MITSENRVLVWGNNGSGNLGNGSVYYVYEPFDITDQFNIPETEKVLLLSIGDGHSGAVTSKGDLYMWGSANIYQTGVNSVSTIFYPI